MNTLMFECPTTGHSIDTGIEINYASLRKVQPVTVRLFCPRCGRPHEMETVRGIDQGAASAAAVESLSRPSLTPIVCRV
jgi:hypothetical protein